MNILDQIDALGLPDNLEEADAEYIRIKLSRCKDSREAEKYRKQLALMEQSLLIAHKERLKSNTKRST